jgi:hypothetical protein
MINKLRLNEVNFSKQIRFFYIINIAFIYFYYDLSFFKYGPSLYQWPLFWFNFTGAEAGLDIVSYLLVFSFSGGAIFYKNVFARILVFISHLFLASALVIPGVVSNHSTYHFLFLSFVLMFYEEGNYERNKKISLSSIFLILYPYFLAGVNKFLNLGFDIFDRTIMERIIVERYLISGKSLLFPEIVGLGIWTEPLFGSLVLLQLTCGFLVFFPKSYKLLGCLLILFHVISYMLLNINFIPSIFVISLFLIYSSIQREA